MSPTTLSGRKGQAGPRPPRRLELARALAGMTRLSTWASVSVLLATGTLACHRAWAQTVPKLPANALPVLKAPVAGIGYTSAGNTGTIVQSGASAIATWNSFDIGSASKLTIQQPGANSVLLNKVEGGAILNRTTIDGALTANGRVYIYNPNGILFGKTATVNVNTLIASSLQFDESRVVGGLLQKGTAPVLGADPALGYRPGAVTVEGDTGQRARIDAATGGLILLAAPTVTNAGALNAPDGQAILAAGSKVYLTAPNTIATGTNLRGLVVEVANDYAAGALGAGMAASVGTSTAENAVGGQISVGRGNATMIGYAVNQNGLVSATTSVTLNGSIYLRARDQAVLPAGGTSYTATRSGTLVLGAGSVTEVQPANDATTIGAKTAFNPSVIDLNGQDIQLQARAQVLAPGGNVTIKAERRLPDGSDLPPVQPATDPVRVDFAPGSVVDVSGMTGTRLAMESNVITVDLRGTELADNTVLRDSPLYGTQVQIDIRKGTPMANVGGWLDLVQRGLGEVNAAGGTVNVSADGAIVQRAGSRIAVDGGYVDYAAGHVNTTQMQLGNSLVDIGSAASGTLYTAAVKLPDSDANAEAGYRQGANAGTVKLSAPILVLQGDLSGQSTAGSRQRVVGGTGTAAVPLGGRLQIGNVGTDTMDLTTGRAKTKAAGDVGFGYEGLLHFGDGATQSAAPPAVDAPFDSAVPDQALLASRLDIDTAALARAGFSRIAALTAGNIEVAAPVALAPGGQFWIGAGQRQPRVGEDAAPVGGNVAIATNVAIPGGSFAAAGSGRLSVADGVSLDTAGLWVNDRGVTEPALDANGNPVAPEVLKGGRIDLSAKTVQIGDGVAADVSAGAWLSAKGQTTAGSAGAIVLEAVAPDAKKPEAASLVWGTGLRLSGYGFAAGGSLKLVGRNVSLGAASSVSQDPGDLALGSDFFQQGGFTQYDIGAKVNLSVAANASIAPRAQRWQLAPDAASRSSGGMGGVATPVLLALAAPGATRSATDLTLRANTANLATAGRVLVGEGARIDLDPGAYLGLFAGRQLTELGSLDAPAGRIQLVRVTDPTNPAYFDNSSIWFGKSASVSAAGTAARIYTGSDGVSSGEVLPGGSIQIGGAQIGSSDVGTAPAYVVALPGSTFKVDGAGASNLAFRSGSGVTAAREVSSDGGSIEIRASEGLLFAGQLSGGAGGAGASGGSLTVALDSASQHGGESVLTVAALAPVGGVVPRNLVPEQSLVYQPTDTSPWLLTGSKPGTTARLEGEGWLPASSFSGGRFGRLTLNSKDAIAFGLGSAELTLSASESLTLDTPTLRADRLVGSTADVGLKAVHHTLTLVAPEVQIGPTDAGVQSAYADPASRAASYGSGRVQVAASTIDLVGNSALQGFGDANLAAAADIRLNGVPYAGDGTAQGSFWMVGNLRLADAQLYPTTFSDFRLEVASASGVTDSGKLNFAGNGNAPGTVLSAGGSLTAVAPQIVQGGRVLAPFGRIQMGNLDASADPILTQSLSYAAVSLTSVAGSGTVPLGSVSDGSVPTASNWQYTLADGTPVDIVQNPATGGANPQRALPAKEIDSLAGAVSTAGTAVLDLSGGGSLYAYGFTPGKGGSRDVLANDTSVSPVTAYAILPGYQSRLAPIDADYGRYTDTAVGSSVYLSGAPGLPAGFYTLLPAHYALLPGGFSVSVAANTRDMQASANTTLADGSMLIAGNWAQSGSGAVASRSQGFTVSSGAVVRKKSEFADYNAADYFSAKAKAQGMAAPELPTDGGQVVFKVTGTDASALTLAGRVNLAAATGGRAGQADFSAPQIEVVSSGTGTGGSGAGVRLAADMLDAMGADSLVIGAVRDSVAAGTHLTVGAGTVSFSNDAAHALQAPEIVVAATGSLSVANGASLRADSAPGRAGEDLILEGSGALLRLSGGDAATVRRSGASFAAGTLDIASGATVAASAAIELDATGPASVRSPLALRAGGALGVGASGISLGDKLPGDAALASASSGLRFDSAALAAFGNLSALSFNSYNATIALYGSVQVGGAATKDLTLAGAGLLRAGSDTGSSASFTADTVRLAGVATPAASVAPATQSGLLSLQAGTVELGSGAFAIQGFAQTALQGRDRIVATGTGGSLSTAGDLQLAAGRIVTAQGADANFIAAGAMRLDPPGAPTSTTALPAPGLGGQLGFAAQSIVADTQILVPGGTVSMRASQSLDLVGGQISTAGVGVAFADTVAYAPGGRIALDAPQVRLGSAATLDVSATGAAAGQLTVKATDGAGNGRADLAGTLRGGAGAGLDGLVPTQGGFSLDTDSAGTGGQFGALNARLNDAGFTESRQFRIRQGDVALAGTDTIVAHDVAIAVDNGNLSVSGQSLIDASGAKGGSIELQASQALASGNAGRVTIAGSAQLIARGTGTPSGDAGSLGQGGRVSIGSGSADGLAASAVDGGSSLTLSGGSIDVGGANERRNGTVSLRAPRVGDGAGIDVAVASLATDIRHSASTAIEATRVYSASQISAAADGDGNLDAGKTGQMYLDAQRFAGRQADILARLANAGAKAAPLLQAGIEVRSTGDLGVSVNEFAANAADRGWNLNDWRFNGQPIALTLRAQGNLNVAGSIGDGFVKPDATAAKLAMPDWALASDNSAHLRFVGGADLGAAAILAVKGNSGDVLFGFAARTPTASDAPVAAIRTGTGAIDIAAARDVKLDTAVGADGVLYGAAIYTAGRADAQSDATYGAPRNALNTQYGAAAGSLTAATFASGGGAISIDAGRDAVGPSVSSTTVQQLTDNWLFRQGRSYVDASGKTVFETLADGTTLNTAWWVRPDYFDQGVATLGGGDIRVDAGRHVADLSLSAATGGYATGTGAGALVERGGGDIAVRAGGDIQGGSFYVQKGRASLRAEGSVGAGNDIPPTGSGTQAALNPVLALGDATVEVVAGRNLAIEASYNPTLTKQNVHNVAAGDATFNPIDGQGVDEGWDPTNAGKADYRSTYAQFSNFSTFGATSAVRLNALGGDVRLSGDTQALSVAGGNDIPPYSSSVANRTALDVLYGYAPPTLRATALSGDVTTSNPIVLAPAAAGQLELLAAGSVRLNNLGIRSIRMLDNDPATVSTAFAPRVLTTTDLAVVNGTATGLAAHTNGGLHSADTAPVRVVALGGDVVGDSSAIASLSLPKKAVIQAGRDIVDLGYSIQNDAAGDLSTVTAGRDLRVTSGNPPGSPVAQVLTGPGRLELQAGRNIDLGNGSGVVTRGNLDNPYLAEGGASIHALAGVSVPPNLAGYVAFASAYGSVYDVSVTSLIPKIDPDTLTAAQLPAVAAAYAVAGLTPPVPVGDPAALSMYKAALQAQKADLASLDSFVRQRVGGVAAGAAAETLWADFRLLPSAEQSLFLSAHPNVVARSAARAEALAQALKAADQTGLETNFFTHLVEAGKSSELKPFDALIASLFPTAAASAGGDISNYASQFKTEQGGAVTLFAPAGSVYAGLTAGVPTKSDANQGIFTIRGGAIDALVKNDFLVNKGRVFTLGGGDIVLVSQEANIDAGKGSKTATSAPPPLIAISPDGSVKVDVSNSISGSGIATLTTRDDQPASNIYAVAPRGIFDAGDAGVRSTGSVFINAAEVRNANNIAAAGGITGAAPVVAAVSVAAVAIPSSSTAKSDEATALGGAASAAANASLTVDVIGYGPTPDTAADDETDDDKKKSKRKKGTPP